MQAHTVSRLKLANSERAIGMPSTLGAAWLSEMKVIGSGSLEMPLNRLSSHMNRAGRQSRRRHVVRVHQPKAARAATE